MTAALPAILSTLRDVQGIAGSFAVLDDGQVLCRDIPALFSDDLLAEIGPRVIRLGDAFATDSDEAASCTVRFQDYLLLVRRLRYARLCVLSAADTNMPALRMAMNLVARRLDSAFEGGLQQTAGGSGSYPAVSPPAPAAATARLTPPPVPGAPAQSTQAARSPVRYRGVVVPKA